MSSPRILGLVMARDEWPLLAISISHALLHHVDRVVVVDHGSEDGTQAGLVRLCEYWRDRLVVVRLERSDFFQEATTSVVADLCNAESCDWFYLFDADEFLITNGQVSLRSILSGVDPGVAIIRYEVHQWVAPHDMNSACLSDYRRILDRAQPNVFEKPSSDFLSNEIENGYLNFFDIPFPSKVIVRGWYAGQVTAGAHGVREPVTGTAINILPDVLRLAHLPLLDRRRLELKCSQGESLVNQGFPSGHGWQSQMLYRMQVKDCLDLFWSRHSMSCESSLQSLALPTCFPGCGLVDAIEAALVVAEDLLSEDNLDSREGQRAVGPNPMLISASLAIGVVHRHLCTSGYQVAQASAEVDKLRAEVNRQKAEVNRQKAEVNRQKAEVSALMEALQVQQSKLDILARAKDRVEKKLQWNRMTLQTLRQENSILSTLNGARYALSWRSQALLLRFLFFLNSSG